MKKIIINLLSTFHKYKRAYRARQLKASRTIEKCNELPDGNILLIIPHADDELIGCNQLICKYKSRITLFYCGFLGSNQSDRNKEIRKKEFEIYCNRVGVRYIESKGKTKEELIKSIQSIKPTVIGAPSIVDWHDEHRQISFLLSSILSEMRSEKPKSILWYHISVPLYGGSANYVCTMSKQQHEEKWSLFKECYKSQSVMDIDRFMLAERNCLSTGYASETFILNDITTFYEKTQKAKVMIDRFRNLKALLRHYNQLVCESESLYGQLNS